MQKTFPKRLKKRFLHLIHFRPGIIQQASGIQICWDIIRFRSVNCDQHPEISHLLNLDPANNSTILLEIVNYTENSTPVLLGRIYVNADIIQLNLIRDLTKLQ